MLAGLIVYPLGIFLFFFVELYRHRKVLNHIMTVNKMGFLYAGYHTSYWWFDLLDMIHKLLLTSFLIFVPTNLQASIGMMIVVTYMIVLLVAHPYLRKGDSVLHLWAQTELFLTLAASRTYYYNETNNINETAMFELPTEQLAVFSMLGSLSFFFLYFIIQMLHLCFKRRKLQIKQNKSIKRRDISNNAN